MGHQENGLSTGAFAKLCGTTKETLRHYKDINLLSPVYQGENGYFYYDPEQFYDFYAILIFRQTGTPLEEIRRCLKCQSTSETMALLKEQRTRLEKERQKLEQMDFVLSQTIGNLELGLLPNMVPQTGWFEEENLLALPAGELEGLMSPSYGESEMLRIVLERCQQLCREYGLETDYQLGAVHQLGKQCSQAAISHLYTRIKKVSDCPYYMKKPAGNYVYLCCRGRWDISEGYAVLNHYIEKNGYITDKCIYACDLAGFILNGTEKNAVSMISARLT